MAPLNTNSGKSRKPLIVLGVGVALAGAALTSWWITRTSHPNVPAIAEAMPMRTTINIVPDSSGTKWLASGGTQYEVKVEFSPGKMPAKVLVNYDFSAGVKKEVLCDNCLPSNPSEIPLPTTITKFNIKTTNFEFAGTRVLKITVTRPNENDTAVDTASAKH